MRILVLALFILGLTACDGGNSNSSSSYTVTAIDGYLSSAEVYVDRDGDGVADSDELVGGTDINGQIVLDNENKAYAIIIRAVAGITYDSDYSEPIAENYEMVSAAGNTVVTPFTTLSYLYDISMDEVVNKLDPDGSLGIDVETISGDYAALDSDTGIVTQALARSVAGVFEDEVLNNMDTGLTSTDTLDSYLDSIVDTLDTQVASTSDIATDLKETVIIIEVDNDGFITPTTTTTTALDTYYSASSDASEVSAVSEAITEFQLTFSQIKRFDFAWPAIDGVTHYKLMENPDGDSGFTQIGEDIDSETLTYSHIVPLYDRMNAQYILQSCNLDDCTNSETISVNDNLASSIGYLSASNAESHDSFGYNLDLSKDGSTLAVSAIYEDSNATGINGDQTNNDAENSGAVYIFTKNDAGEWSQETYIKASNTEAGDVFGYSLALDETGDTLAVAAALEGSNATGINGDQTNNDAQNAGAVYVFTRNSGTWSQETYIKPSNTNSFDVFGQSLSLSADGNTLAVGAPGQDSPSSGINGDQSLSDTNSIYGAVYLFTRSDSTWTQHSFIKASNADARDYFGSSVALSSDGKTLAVGATGEDSNATGSNGDQSDNSSSSSGAVYVFTSDIDGSWSQQAYVKPSNTGPKFGFSVALSEDGSTMAVGTIVEQSNATGINGDQTDTSLGQAGAVYTFTRDDSQSWSQQAYIKASNTEEFTQFGYSLDLSSDGNTLAVGSNWEHSNAIGINGDQSNFSYMGGGAVYMFSRIDSTWSQKAYVKASTPGDHVFGNSVSLSSDATTLAVGATAGAAYLY